MEPELEAQKQPRPRRRSRRASGLNAGGSGGPSADTPRPEPDGRHSLRRGSSFTFLTPGPHWDFTLKRKRRAKDDDVISLNSLDLKGFPRLISNYLLFPAKVNKNKQYPDQKK
ncbi:neuroepithelial cell-transforming gene 1 protein-like [Meles meles]|uniref:neuroepithelial cell-transforming gene 1 protein-like n=1 Tax=Meles meles TaxID=9662 RepID=UPI001E69C03E|nr:neuroepithelial cell-transforming gene 1 protein-like [Meles meles]